MNKTTEIFLLTAPPQVRTALVRAVDHETREAHRRCVARPGAIKKIRADKAEKVIELIDDPALLAAIYHKDNRKRVDAAVRLHPLWSCVPHEELCDQCRAHGATVRALSTAEEVRSYLAVTPIRCSVLVIRMLDALDPDIAKELWGEVKNLIENSAALQVSIAAGRGRYASEAGRPRGWPGNDLARLLNAEPVVTGDLLNLAVNQKIAIPPHWRPSEEQWQKVLLTSLRSLLRFVDGPGTDFFLRNWVLIPENDRPWVLDTVKTLDEAVAVVDRLMQEPFVFADSGPSYNAVLLRYPEMGPERRVHLMLRSGRSSLMDCLIGLRGPRATAEEIGLVFAKLDALDERSFLRSTARIFGRQFDLPVSAEHQVLVAALVDRLPVAVVVESAGALAHEAHRRIWEKLDPEIHAEILGGLLADWGGTVGELIETTTTV